jgi:hypothetical protein
MLNDVNDISGSGCQWAPSLRQVMGPFVVLRCWVSGAEAVSVINELERVLLGHHGGWMQEVIGWWPIFSFINIFIMSFTCGTWDGLKSPTRATSCLFLCNTTEQEIV